MFTGRDYHGGEVKCYYVPDIEGSAYIVLSFSDGEISPLEISFGSSGNGVMSWQWEEVVQPVTAFEAIQICMTSDKSVSFHREDDDSLLMYSKGDGIVMFT